MDKKTLIKSAYLHFREGRWDQAIDHYRKILDLDPADINALNMLGDVLARQGQVTEAIKYYRSAIEVFRKLGAESKIEIIQRKMVKLDPDSADAVNPVLETETSADGHVGAETNAEVETLKQAIAANPKNVESYQKLGDLLVKLGRNREAGEQYFVIGNALYNNRMYKKAIPVFQRILEIDSGNLQARIALGESYSKDGSDSDAKKELLFVAEHLIRQGNLEKGQLFAQKAIQLKSIEAHYYLGLVYFLKGQSAEAEHEFETLLKFKVSHQGALTHMARLKNDAGKLDEAFALYERLVKIDSKNADALEKMGEIALAQGNTSAALERFSQAMDAFASDEQWERAASCANQAVQLDPSNHELYLKLADASYNAGLETQAAEACSALADVLDQEGRSAEAEQMRGKARELTGEAPPPPVEAQMPPPRPQPTPPPKMATPVKDESQVMMNIADNYVQQGSLDEAIEIYQKILKTDPNNEKVKNALTRVYAMFAGINPETAVTMRHSAAKDAGAGDEKEEQRAQREARERAQREAQVRAQRNTVAEAPVQPPVKVSVKESGLPHALERDREDEIGGDHQDEFMTVTVAEIYTKQGLLTEALKIYQKILEFEPGNMEAQVKKQELENKLAEQEKLRQQTEKAAQETKKTNVEKSTVQPNRPEPELEEKSKKPGKDDDEPPKGGRRGRVSYV